jgi:uncharacterized damage-inducible protein DinB
VGLSISELLDLPYSTRHQTRLKASTYRKLTIDENLITGGFQMSYRDHLLYMLRANQMVIKRLIDDITDQESMVRGKDQCNHIRWLTGHMITGESHVLSLLGGKNDDSRNYEKNFGRGSVITDDPSVYPSMAELKKRLYDIHERATNLVEKISEAELQRETGQEEKKEPLWQSLTFLFMHEFYHAGQIASARRIIGRERSFG